MADPLAIIGAAASIVSIIDVLARSISTVRELRDQWKDADFTVLNLVAQLTALKAALTKIKEWTDTELAEAHHQLIMDLDDSVTCCRILVGKVDTLLLELRQKPNETLDWLARTKLLLGSKSMDDLQKMIERQTCALTLLLTACNFKTISEQKIFLEKSSTRKTLKHVTDDSASLIVHRDTNSLFSRYTDNLSKISMVFNFDSEVFGSKVYERAFRGALKAVVRQQQSDTKPIDSRNLSRGNEEIEKRIRADKKRQLREVKILLLGVGESDKSTFLEQIRLIYCKRTDYERRQLRVVIFKNIVNAFRIILGLMEELEIDFEDDDNISYAQYIASDPNINSEEPLPEYFLLVFKRLWADRGVQVAMIKGNEYALHDSLDYFFKDIERLFVRDYLPTERDILRTKLRTTGVSETALDLGNLTYRIFDVGGQRSERKKWIHVFDNIQAVLFLAAIGDYDQALVEDRSANQMHEALMLFESIANSVHFANSVLILFFTKTDIFREKLLSGMAPIEKYFSDYGGESTDIIAAQEFFARKFRSVVRVPERGIYFYFINHKDTHCIKKVMESINHAIVERNLGYLV